MAANLTQKEKGFVKDYVETGNGTQSALQNYDTDNENTAASIASQNLRKLKIQDAIQSMLPDDFVGGKHLELFKAARIELMQFPPGPKTRIEELNPDNTDISDEEIKEMFADVSCKVSRIIRREGQRFVYYHSPDNNAKKHAIDMAYKLKGRYAPEKSINFNVDVEADEVVKALTEKLNEIYGGTSQPSNGTPSGSVGTQTQD